MLTSVPLGALVVAVGGLLMLLGAIFVPVMVGNKATNPKRGLARMPESPQRRQSGRRRAQWRKPNVTRRAAFISRLKASLERPIVRVFNDNDLQGRLTSATATGRYIVWTVQLHNFRMTDINRVNKLDAALEKALGIAGVQIRSQRGKTLLEVPLPRKTWGTIRADRLPDGSLLQVAPGLEYDQRPYWVDMGQPSKPHLLILGSTGSGKSETMLTLLYLLARQNLPEDLRMVLIDMKGGQALTKVSGLNHVTHEVANTPKQAGAALEWAVGEMRARQAAGTWQQHIVVAVDEVFMLTQRWQDASKLLEALATQGRSAGIHLLLGTQRATKDTLGDSSMIGSNVPARIIGKVSDAKVSAHDLGVPKSGAEKLLGPGDMISNAGDYLARIQVAITPVEAIESLSAYSPGPRRVWPVDEVEEPTDDRGGHNKAELDEEWIQWALENPSDYNRDGVASQNMLKRELQLSSSVAKRVKEEAKRRVQSASG